VGGWCGCGIDAPFMGCWYCDCCAPSNRCIGGRRRCVCDMELCAPWPLVRYASRYCASPGGLSLLLWYSYGRCIGGLLSLLLDDGWEDA